MHGISPRAFAGILGRARWRTVGTAVAAGLAGSALVVIPAMAQVGNEPPEAQDDTYAVVQDTATVLAVLGNDTDPDGDTLTIQSLSVPAHGTTALSGGTLTYTPASGYTGADTFTYTVGDGHGNYDTATVTLAIAPTVGIPDAQDDSVSVAMDTAISIAVLANDTDPDGQALTVTAVSTPAHGTASIVGGTTITYTPAAGYTGTDSFSYTVSDGFGSTDLATVTVTVTAPDANEAPVVQNDTANVLMNHRTQLHLLSNDSDPDGDALTIASVGTPVHGAVAIAADGKSVTYAPPNGYIGGDSFSYTVNDGHGHTVTGSVALVVLETGTLIANNDAVSMRADTAKRINVLRNDEPSDEDNDLTVTSVGAPAHGTAVITDDAQKVTYTPTAGYTGTDTFTYTVTETGGASASATVTVTVRAASHDDDDDDDFDKEDCKDGRWVELGFRNQGLCIARANHEFMKNGRPLFPHGLFPNGLFPNGLFPDGVFTKHSDDDDRNVSIRRASSDDDDDHRGIGARIRQSVRASLDQNVEAKWDGKSGKHGKGKHRD